MLEKQHYVDHAPSIGDPQPARLSPNPMPMIRLRPLLVLLLAACTRAVAPVHTGPLVDAPVEVLLVGTFHFADVDSVQYDILSGTRRAEVQRVVDALVAWGPDKVFVESQPEFNQTRLDSLVALARSGALLRQRNEIHQLAIPTAVRRGHARVYAFDHPGRYGSLRGVMVTAARVLGQQSLLDGTAPFTTRAPYETANLDSVRARVSVAGYLQLLNAPQYQRLDHAVYVGRYARIGAVRTDLADSVGQSRAGAELVADWYRRNVMMYGKVAKWLDWSERRIVVIVGNGHASILRHLFESSGAYRVVDAAEVLPQR
jgi:hypothetical protein